MAQIIIFSVLLVAIFLFMWGKWRYDVVSLMAFLAVVLLGALAPEEAFAGFSHPAVVIVAAIFVVSKGLANSGIVEYIVRKFTLLDRHPVFQLSVLVVLTTVFSAFLNNVGAIAFMMPIAIKMARRSDVTPAMFLLPLAFASHLGGYLTLIGTPRNILISTFRQEAVGEPFLMFDFAYVGGGVALVGVLFLSFIGWRLIPKDRSPREEVFEINDYVAEIVVSEGSVPVGKQLGKVFDPETTDCKPTALIRNDRHINNPADYVVLRPEDILLIQADADSLENFVEENNLQLGGKQAEEKGVSEDPVAEENIPMEAAVMPESNIIGKMWHEIKLSWRYGVNLLAVSREGEEIKERIQDIRFRPGDVLLLYGRRESVEDTVTQTGCVPLAEREVLLGRDTRVWPPLIIFTLAIIFASFGLFPLEIIFLTAALAMILTNSISLKEAYDSIRWQAIILLGSMISIGIAFESTGGAETVSNFLANSLADYASPVLMIGVVLVVSMFFSDFVNATTGAVLMSPVAIIIAQSIGASVDPFLMAVAVGVSSAFLTPFGHESNVLVMGPGGYKFKDYIKVGLPLEILIFTTSIPLILHFWPLY